MNYQKQVISLEEYFEVQQKYTTSKHPTAQLKMINFKPHTKYQLQNLINKRRCTTNNTIYTTKKNPDSDSPS